MNQCGCGATIVISLCAIVISLWQVTARNTQAPEQFVGEESQVSDFAQIATAGQCIYTGSSSISSNWEEVVLIGAQWVIGGIHHVDTTTSLCGDTSLMYFVFDAVHKCHGHVRGHVTHVNLEDSAFGRTLYAVDDDGVFQQFFLFEDFKHTFQHTVAKWPVQIQTFGQTQMQYVLGVDDCFILRMTESGATTVGHVGLCVCTAGPAHLRMIDIGVTGADCSGSQILKIDVEIFDHILFGLFAFGFIDNDLDDLVHFGPVQLKCFGITQENLITVFDGVAHQFKQSFVEFVESDPLQQLIFQNLDFIVGGFVFEI